MWSSIQQRQRKRNFGNRSTNNGAHSFEKLEPRQLLCIGLSGSISIETTLSNTTSEYCLVDDLVVDSGATLAIEPGVTIEFRNDVVDLIVSGGSVLADGAVFSRGEFTGGEVSITVNEAGVFGATNSKILGNSNIVVNDGGLFGVQGGEFNEDTTARFHEINVNNGGEFFARDLLFTSDTRFDPIQNRNYGIEVKDGARLNFVDSNVNAFVRYNEGAKGNLLGNQLWGRLEYTTPLAISDTVFQAMRPVTTTASSLSSLRDNGNTFAIPGQRIELLGQGAYSANLSPIGEAATFALPRYFTFDKTTVITPGTILEPVGDGVDNGPVQVDAPVYMDGITAQRLTFTVRDSLLAISSSELNSVVYSSDSTGHVVDSTLKTLLAVGLEQIRGNVFRGGSIKTSGQVFNSLIHNNDFDDTNIFVEDTAIGSGEIAVFRPVEGSSVFVRRLMTIGDGGAVYMEPGVKYSELISLSKLEANFLPRELS